MAVQIRCRYRRGWASPIRKLTPYADKAKAEGKHVYHLNIGQPDIETPQGMLDAVRGIDFKVWEYTPSEGTASYRNKLSGYYNPLGYDITPTDILVTNGGSEALTIAMQACISPGEEIIIPEPFYANYNSFACSAGCSLLSKWVINAEASCSSCSKYNLW